MFLIRPPHRTKVLKKTTNAQEVLNRLESYLDANNEEPVRLLCNFWNDQKNAITYKELRDTVSSGYLSQDIYEAWQQDYSKLVTEKLTPVWERAISAGTSGQPMFDSLSFHTNTTTPGVVNWISNRGASFVTNSTDEQKSAIQSLVMNSVVQSHSVDELAKLIRPCIGLTEGQTQAALKYYDNMISTMREQHPRMSLSSIQKKALDSTQKYAERMNRDRAYTIAETEMAFAYNWGAYEGILQAQEAGLLGTVKKVWSTSGDENVCPDCAAMEGVELGLEDSFKLPGVELFPNQHMLPPAHPRCACAVEYIETEKPKFTPEEEEKDETSPVPDKPIRPRAADYDDYDELDEARQEYWKEKAEWDSEIDSIVDEQMPQHSMTQAEITAWCQEHGIGIEGSLNDVDGRLLTKFTERFEKLSADFPEAVNITVKFDGEVYVSKYTLEYTGDNDYVCEATRGLSFGRSCKDAENVAKSELEQMGEGFFVNTGKSIDTLFDHEYGHRVYTAMQHAGDRDTEDMVAMDHDLINSVYEKSGMSDYATTNVYELFAEGFAAYYGGVDSDFARATGEFIERWRLT